MNEKELNAMSLRHRADEHKVRKAINAFLCGGLVSVLAQLTHDQLLTTFSKENAAILTTLIFIFLASVLSGFGVYDKMAKFAGAGLFIPITGFSNSLTSSAMECKREGLVFGIGSNMFKLAGSVITYGIVSAILFSLVTYWVRML